MSTQPSTHPSTHPDFSLATYGLTKIEAATKLYPELIYDTALPQDWVNEALDTTGFDVRPHFVWGYPKGSLFGKPYPLTQTGHDWLTGHLEHIGHARCSRRSA